MLVSRHRPRRGLIALEWILIVTVLVIGIIAGLGLVRNAVVQEMYLLSQSILGLQVDPNAIQAPANAFNSNDFNGNDFNNNDPLNNFLESGPDTILEPNDPLLQ